MISYTHQTFTFRMVLIIIGLLIILYLDVFHHLLSESLSSVRVIFFVLSLPFGTFVKLKVTVAIFFFMFRYFLAKISFVTSVCKTTGFSKILLNLIKCSIFLHKSEIHLFQRSVYILFVHNTRKDSVYLI